MARPSPSPAQEGKGAPARAIQQAGIFPRWVLLLIGLALTAAIMAAVAGEEMANVFQTYIYAIFVLPVLLAAWVFGILLTEPFAARGCFEGSPWPIGFRCLAAEALGLGAFALAALALGTLHLVEPAGMAWPLILIPALGFAAGVVPAQRFLKKRGSVPSYLRERAHRGDWLFLLAAVPAAILLIAATFPPGSLWRTEALGYDVMEYHLELPRQYALFNFTAPLHQNVYSYLPANVEMLYLLLMQFAKTVMGADRATGYLWGTFPAQFCHAALMLLTAATLALVPPGGKEKPWLTATGRAVAVLLFLGVPWTLVTGSLAYNEGGMLFFGTLAIGVALGDGKTGARGVLAGVLLGLAVGCKMTAGVFFAIPVAAVFLVRAAGDGAQLRALALATLVAVGVYSPWAIRAAIYSSGNPVFPIATSILPKNDWTPQQGERFDRGHAAPEAQRALPARLAALADCSLFDPQWSVQPYFLLHISDDPPVLLDALWKRLGILWIGLLLALACAFVARAGRGETGLLFMILIIQLLAWLFTTHLQGRFLLPVAIPLALLAGRGVQGLSISAEGIPVAALRIAAGTLVALHALSTVFLLLPEAHLLDGVVPLRSLPDWYPLPNPPIGNAFAEVFNLAAAVERPNDATADTPPAKTLLVGEARAWRYIGDVDYFTVFDSHPFVEALHAGPDKGAAWLKQNHIRYVLFNWAEIERLRKSYGFDALMTPEIIPGLEKAGIQDTHAQSGAPLTILRVPESP